MTDIALIFARDPLSYTKEGQELETVVREMRKARNNFNAGNMKAGSTKPKTEKQKAVAELLSGLSIDL